MGCEGPLRTYASDRGRVGKDLRTSELTAADCLITLTRGLLPDQNEIKWDEMTKENESAHSDLLNFLHFLRNQSQLLDGNCRSFLLISDTMSSMAQRELSQQVRSEKTTGGFLLDNGPHASVADSCPICKGSHKGSACPEVLKVNKRQRRVLTRKAGLCFSCLETGHEAKSGKFSDSLQDRHQKEGERLRPVMVNLALVEESGGSRLQIIRALAHGDGGKKMVVNCLFVTAAQRSFIREDVAHELGLREVTACELLAGPLVRKARRQEGVRVIVEVDYFICMLGSTIVRGDDDDPVAVETCLG
ncbi:hypothetical protein T4D_9074 [Trichinella pseudospiralis]|uniref:Uncharacterized protein n=1 Tax=Trichinella pseudospiralis TaxID=6337 RepID=A0A0V1FD14_TRIPS|nr:hypothetical protein T4D_9074 [Trichinella pseudospiralis]